MINLTELFCNIDDFWISFEKLWKKKLIDEGKKEPRREPSLCVSEVMTILVLFHIRLLAKLHLPAKIAVFTIFISKFFGHMYTYALKIFR